MVREPVPVVAADDLAVFARDEFEFALTDRSFGSRNLRATQHAFGEEVENITPRHDRWIDAQQPEQGSHGGPIGERVAAAALNVIRPAVRCSCSKPRYGSGWGSRRRCGARVFRAAMFADQPHHRPHLVVGVGGMDDLRRQDVAIGFDDGAPALRVSSSPSSAGIVAGRCEHHHVGQRRRRGFRCRIRLMF